MSRAVAIIGAGTLGGVLAHRLASRQLASSITLIDDNARVAAGKALDIQQAGPVEAFDTRLRAGGEVTAARDAAVVIVADPVDDVASGTPDVHAVAQLDRLLALNASVVVVCARPAHRTLVRQLVADLGLPRERVVGSAPVAFGSAVTAMTALEMRASPRDVAVATLGSPPDRGVVSWSTATVAGYPVESRLDPVGLARLKRRIPELWPPGPYGLASAAALVTEAILIGSTRRLSCFVVLDGELGVHGPATAMPVLVGPRGVTAVLVPALSPLERVRLENALP